MAEADAISDTMAARAAPMVITSLKEEGWILQPPQVLRLLDKIRKAGRPLGEVVDGKFYRWILTGYNEAFVIDEAKRAELVAQDPKSAEIIKPFLRGRDIKRWRVQWAGLYLIKTEIGVDIRRYPAIFTHLAQYQPQLEKRYDKGKHWWELRACDYYREFDRPKIVYPDITEHTSFAFDMSGALAANTTYFIPTDDLTLAGLLNSPLVEFYYRHLSAQVRGGYLRAFSTYIGQLPVACEWIAEHVEALLADQIKESERTTHEHAIDQAVYQMYGLTKAEVALIENGTR